MDDALDSIVPIVEEAEKEQEQLNDAKLKKHEEEQGKAIEMRGRSLETFAETKTLKQKWRRAPQKAKSFNWIRYIQVPERKG